MFMTFFLFRSDSSLICQNHHSTEYFIIKLHISLEEDFHLFPFFSFCTIIRSLYPLEERELAFRCGSRTTLEAS